MLVDSSHELRRKNLRRPDRRDEQLESSSDEFSINISDLDLDVSYVDKIAPPAPSIRGERTRWQNPGPTIDDQYEVPPGWDENEPDLDPEDFDAQILRCQERIRDRIMPRIFERKMESFKKQKKQKELLLAKYPGLDESSALRLDVLQSIQKWLQDTENNNDKDQPKQLKNVKAIIDAYKSKALSWNQGLVTYWINGVQRSQPRPLNFEELWCLARESGYKSFWVEGITTPGFPTIGAAKRIVYKRENDNSCAAFTNDISLTLWKPINQRALPYKKFKPAYCQFKFMHDTGADFMMIYEEDLRTLQQNEIDQGKAPSPVVCVGTTTVQTLMGPFHAHIYTVTVRVQSQMAPAVDGEAPDVKFMTNWESIFTIVKPGSVNDAGSIPRIDGPWIRYRLWTATRPDDTGETHVAEHRTGIVELPTSAEHLSRNKKCMQVISDYNIPHPPFGPPSDPPPFAPLPPAGPAAGPPAGPPAGPAAGPAYGSPAGPAGIAAGPAYGAPGGYYFQAPPAYGPPAGPAAGPAYGAPGGYYFQAPPAYAAAPGTSGGYYVVPRTPPGYLATSGVVEPVAPPDDHVRQRSPPDENK
ncbi:hypothetical protein N7456_008843 [Penicillium angulare]|uniref:Uncharacterized protein n=1 Tax=Penicillium angulare TaxID=116970 RepID=A0A9W9F3N4_9EURO|nr:hypothetical protein N7456_008843 [Penicillium angulare]